MRLIDWLLISVLFLGLIAGRKNLENKSPFTQENPRRPPIQKFQKSGDLQLWERETYNWKSISPKQAPSKIAAYDLVSPHLNKEGTIESFKKKYSSVGSAFSLSKSGIWLTAAHVVRDCSQVSIQIHQMGYLPVVKVSFHPKADIAVLFTRLGSKAMEFEPAEVPGDSFSIGFPQAFPGAVHSRFLGTMKLHHKIIGQKYAGFREIVNVWGEISRVSRYSGSLGGLSGGAVLNKDGNLTGVVQAENVRRARIFTSRKTLIKELLKTENLNFPTISTRLPTAILNSETYHLIARQHILNKTVAKVNCKISPL